MDANQVVVIGGGLGGLAVAALLGKAGFRVTLFEKSSRFGGRVASIITPAYTLNLGPHALYRRGPAEAVLGALGASYSGGRPVVAGAVGTLEGVPVPLPVGASSLLKSRWLSFSERIELVKFLSRLQRPQQGLEAISVARWLDRELPSPRLRQLAGALVRLSGYVNAPELLSADAAQAQLAASTRGVWYLDGGWQTLVGELVRIACGAGVDLRRGVPLRGLNVHEAQVTGVVLGDGTVVPAANVVLAVAPRRAAALNPGDESLSRFAERAIPARVACLDVVLEHLPSPARPLLLGIDTPTYASVHSLSARLSERGYAVVHVVKYLRPGAGASAQELLDVLGQLQPCYEGLVVYRRFLPTMEVVTAIPEPASGGLRGRPAPSSPVTRGVHYVGDWVGGERMLADAVFASARTVAARLAAERQRIAA